MSAILHSLLSPNIACMLTMDANQCVARGLHVWVCKCDWPLDCCCLEAAPIGLELLLAIKVPSRSAFVLLSALMRAVLQLAYW